MAVKRTQFNGQVKRLKIFEGNSPDIYKSNKDSRECLIKFLTTRVPIENGLGLHQVLNFIKLPALIGTELKIYKQS